MNRSSPFTGRTTRLHLARHFSAVLFTLVGIFAGLLLATAPSINTLAGVLLFVAVLMAWEAR